LHWPFPDTAVKSVGSEDKGARGRTVTLKVKFANFELISRSRTLPGSVESRSELESMTFDLLRTVFM
jgi:DNA polymerase-4